MYQTVWIEAQNTALQEVSITHIPRLQLVVELRGSNREIQRWFHSTFRPHSFGFKRFWSVMTIKALLLAAKRLGLQVLCIMKSEDIRCMFEAWTKSSTSSHIFLCCLGKKKIPFFWATQSWVTDQWSCVLIMSIILIKTFPRLWGNRIENSFSIKVDFSRGLLQTNQHLQMFYKTNPLVLYAFLWSGAKNVV